MRTMFYITNQAEGAIPNGTVIVKVNTEKDDANPIGTKGKVLGSLPVNITPEERAKLPEAGRDSRFFYFVEWESTPGVPVGVTSWKIAPE